MEIVPEPHSVLDLVHQWHSASCPAQACPAYVTTRWLTTNEPLPPAFDLCPLHARELIPCAEGEKTERAHSLMVDLRATLQLDSTISRLLASNPWASREPITLYGFDLHSQTTTCSIAAFFIRGYSKVPADKLNARQAEHGFIRPPYEAFPLAHPRIMDGTVVHSEVHVWLAYAATLEADPAARLLLHWNPSSQHSDFKRVLEEPARLTPRQERELNNVLNQELRSVQTKSGRHALTTEDLDSRLIAQAEKYLLSNPGGVITRDQFCDVVGIPASTIRDWLKGSSFSDWSEFRKLHLPPYRSRVRQIRRP